MKTNQMRKMHVAILAAATMLSLTVTSAFAEGKQDFELHNDTGVKIHKVFISPTTTDKWEENVLGEDGFELAPDTSVKIEFDENEEADEWDLKVEDDAGTSLEWKGLKLKEITDITLHFANGEGTAELKNGG